MRYRYNEQQRKRFKTIEPIVEESPWSPPAARMPDGTIIGVRVALPEVDLQRQVKQAGGKWNPQRRVWELAYGRALALGLKARIAETTVTDSRNRKSY